MRTIIGGAHPLEKSAISLLRRFYETDSLTCRKTRLRLDYRVGHDLMNGRGYIDMLVITAYDFCILIPR